MSGRDKSTISRDMRRDCTHVFLSRKMIDYLKKNKLLSFFIIFTFAGFLFRLILFLQFPQIYSFDGCRRIWNYEHILVLHWLPGFQILIYLFLKISHSIFALRFLLAGIAGLTCGSSYLLGQRLFNHRVGFILATLLVFCPTFVTWSIVPYQEALFLFLIFMGIFFYLSNNPSSIYLAAIFISLSCLTRYEGWILCGIIIFNMMLKGNKREKNCLYCSIYFLTGIIIWLFIKNVIQIEPAIGGPGGPFNNSAIENFKTLLSLDFLSMLKILWIHLIMCIYHLVWFMGIPSFCLAIVGLFFFIKEEFDFKKYIMTFMIILLLLTAVRSFGSAFTSRMFVFPIVFLLFPTALCLSKIGTIADHLKSKLKWGFIFMLIIIVASYVRTSVLEVRRLSSLFVEEHNVAKFIETLDPNSKILIHPRKVKSPWGESTISAIIGNSLKLRIGQNIFSYDMLSRKDLEEINLFKEKQGIDYEVIYNNGKYHFYKTGLY